MSGPFPKTRKLSCEVLNAEGALPVSCISVDGGIYPALCAVKDDDGCPESVLAATYIKRYSRFVCLTDEGVYFTDFGGNYVLSRFEVDFTNPFFFECDGDTYLVGDNHAIIFRSDRNKIVDLKSQICCGAAKNGRLFAVDSEDKFKLHWTGTEGGADWTESVGGAGSVNIDGTRGEILDITVYKQKLVLSCANGIVIFNAYGNPENFKLQYIDGLIENVVKGTSTVAGGKLVLCAEKGIYSFDGVSAEKLDIPLFKDMKNIAFAKGLGDDYYISAESLALKRKVVYVVNVKAKTAYIVDVAAKLFYENGCMYCFTDDGRYALKKGENFTYLSGVFDFETRGKKTVTALHFGNEKPIAITLFADGRERTFAKAEGYIRPKLRGEKFKVLIKGSGEVKGVKAIAEAGYDV
ncbi:MAG: hypothetical protein K2K80_08165 [Clostridia bacterium]|nr:hypothetical protein [Clostridia bacterium]